MVEKGDWRLTNQKNYLDGVVLHWKKYNKDVMHHEHCSFCWSEFYSGDGDYLREGYTTEDRKHWICSNCFKDFKEMFLWKIAL